MTETLHINTEPAYSVFLGKNLLSKTFLTQLIGSKISKIIIVSDHNVAKYHASKLQNLLSAYSTHLLCIDPGENSKTRETKIWLEDKMLEFGCGRDSLVIALGGGVVTDLAGFVAATYMRGIPTIYCPTSLLGMVDASIGGKTGLNTSVGKNIIGTFTQPKAVIIDIQTLSTLPQSEYIQAFAEIIKHALIADAQYFHWLDEHAEDLIRRDDKYILEAIKRSLQVKKAFILEDIHDELGHRKYLNLGHTTAHAIEHVTNYQISHGEAVAIGIVFEANIAVENGILTSEEYRKIVSIFDKYQLPTRLPEGLNQSEMNCAMKMDKKNKDGQIKMVFLSEIGKPAE